MSGSPANLEVAVKFHPLCEGIIQFLSQHEGAMDTLQGVATCWVNSEEMAVQSALDYLISAGVVVTRALSSGTYYSLTTDPKVRGWVKSKISDALKGRDAPRDCPYGTEIVAGESA